MELRKNDELLLKFCEQVQDFHPIFKPIEHKLVVMLINHHHHKKLCVRVLLAMSSVKEEFLIPK